MQAPPTSAQQGGIAPQGFLLPLQFVSAAVSIVPLLVPVVVVVALPVVVVAVALAVVVVVVALAVVVVALFVSLSVP